MSLLAAPAGGFTAAGFKEAIAAIVGAIPSLAFGLGFGVGAVVTNALLTPEAINSLTHAVDAIENEVKSSEQKFIPKQNAAEEVVGVGNGRPCITVTGKMVAPGTYAFIRHDKVPGSKPHYPFVGDHYPSPESESRSKNRKVLLEW